MYFFGRLLQFLIVSILGLGSSQTAEAGVLATLGPSWNNFVFEPLESEDTPNYYGYGASGAFGYSFGRILDLALMSTYSPGRQNTATALSPTASVITYGGELGLRMFRSFYVGGRGGIWDYRLLKSMTDNEVSGHWTGYGGEACLGLFLPVGMQAAWQIQMNMGQGVVTKQNKKDDEKDLKQRRLSKTSIEVVFVYNGYQSTSLDSALLNSFVNSLF